MSNDTIRETGILRHWYWVWLTSGLFVGLMFVFVFTRYPVWMHKSYRGFGLPFEMNYAVWWSGICFFLAAIIFVRVGHIEQQQGRKSWIWYIVGVAMLALCVDEVGSLHEIVSELSGWLGLLPFALVFAIIFCLAWFHLIVERATRVVAILIATGFLIFIMVAGLEALEHNSSLHIFWTRVRHVVEEGIELVGSGVLLMAGLVAMKAVGDSDRSFLNVTSIVNYIFNFPFIVFLGFVMQVELVAIYLAPNYTFFSEGNPAVLFPMLLFFCLGIVAWLHAVRSTRRVFWYSQGCIFFAVSAMQMYNLNTFINQMTGVPFNLFTPPPRSWIVTIIPFATLSWYFLRERIYGVSRLGLHLSLIGVIFLIVYPDLKYPYRIEFLYFIFSGAIAYCCYLLLREVYLIDNASSD